MIKVYPHINEGTGYIQLSRLPLNQVIKLRNCLSRNSLIKVRKDTMVIEDCIQYSEYEYWFDSIDTKLENETEFGF